jgi:hypothetical protein
MQLKLLTIFKFFRNERKSTFERLIGVYRQIYR